MIPFSFPTFTNPLNEAGECKVSYLSSVSGLTAWTDYIPVQTVVYTGNVEGRTEANGYQAVHPVGASGNVAWTDYIPVYEDATKTAPWSTDANGYIPVGLSEDGVQAFLDKADIGLGDITHSAIATAGSLTPNFTRATEKRIPDHEGVLRTLIAGELGFPGARREYNLWGAASSTLANGANNSMTLPAGAYQFSMGAGTGTATFSGTGGATGTLAASASGRVFVAKTITAGTLVVTASVADLVDLQVVSMVGCSDQTTIREYVSVGVESAPAYHGSCVDGVRCFPYSLDGTPLTTMTTPLIELAATNLCLQSNSFDTTWVKYLGLTQAQNAIGPDGATSAWTLTDDSAVNTELLYQTVGPLTADTYTLSVFVEKTSGATTFPVVSIGGATKAALMTIDTNNGVASVWSSAVGFSGVNGTASCADFNDSFWRASVTFTAAAELTEIDIAPAATTNATQSTGSRDVTAQGSAVFYGTQLELGTAATSYIPTTTVAATRNADQLYYTGADIANIKTLAAIGFKRESGFANNGFVVALSDNTVNNYLGHTQFDSTSQYIQGLSGGAVQWNQLTSNAYTQGQFSNTAQSFAANDIKMSKDGVSQTADTSATIPTVSRLEYGMLTGAFQLNGYPGSIYGWTRNLSQSELNAITQ